MKKQDVKLGHVYAVKVSGKVVPVLIKREALTGGWFGVNQKTKREVRIRSAARLRYDWHMPNATARLTSMQFAMVRNIAEQTAQRVLPETIAELGSVSGEEARALVYENINLPENLRGFPEREIKSAIAAAIDKARYSL